MEVAEDGTWSKQLVWKKLNETVAKLFMVALAYRSPFF
jgi:hypothetical protein